MDKWDNCQYPAIIEKGYFLIIMGITIKMEGLIAYSDDSDDNDASRSGGGLVNYGDSDEEGDLIVPAKSSVTVPVELVGKREDLSVPRSPRSPRRRGDSGIVPGHTLDPNVGGVYRPRRLSDYLPRVAEGSVDEGVQEKVKEQIDGGYAHLILCHYIQYCIPVLSSLSLSLFLSHPHHACSLISSSKTYLNLLSYPNPHSLNHEPSPSCGDVVGRVSTTS